MDSIKAYLANFDYDNAEADFHLRDLKCFCCMITSCALMFFEVTRMSNRGGGTVSGMHESIEECSSKCQTAARAACQKCAIEVLQTAPPPTHQRAFAKSLVLVKHELLTVV